MKFKQYWNLLGVYNDFSVISGTMEEWKELKNNIIANGILLYGKFSSIPEGNHMVIVYWGEIKPNSKRVLFNKKIFGYKKDKKIYPGILQKYDGKKIGKGAISMPIEAQKEIKEIFKRFEIISKMIRIMEFY